MSFIESLSKLASTVGGILGGPLIPAAIEIGKEVVDLIQRAKDVVNEDDLPKLEAMLDELEPKVLAHADATEAKLRGN